MSRAVVVIGPKVIAGPGALDPEVASVALDCIDDELALLADEVLSVDELWSEVMRLTIGGSNGAVALICPSWWADSRRERIAVAARRWTVNPIVRGRAEVLASRPAIVELAPELVVVHTVGHLHALARTGSVVDAIVARVRGLDAVAIDVPTGLERCGAEVSHALQRAGVAVTTIDDHALIRLVRADEAAADATPRWRRIAMAPRVAAVAVAVLSTAALSAAAVVQRAEPVEAGETTWVVEGRLAVEVPVQWRIERITSGPGSARLQVVSPTNDGSVIHVTQSGLPGDSGLDATAEVLQAALAQERDGIFVDFTARGERAGRPAVTYTEVRAGRRIDWTVLVDGRVRIAIGCQGTAEQPGPAQQCDQAIRSVHQVNRK